MLLPILGQIATDGLLPLLAEIGMLLRVALNQIIPLAFVLLSALEGAAKMFQGFIGNKKLFIFWPSQMPLGFTHGLFARRIAMSLARACRGHAVTDYGLD